MATELEKKLAIKILTERIEHATGKKVVLKEGVSSTIDGVKLVKDDDGKVSFHFPANMTSAAAASWKTKNATAIATFKNKKVEKKEEEKPEEKKEEIKEAVKPRLSSELREAVIREVGTRNLKESWLVPNDAEKAYELILKVGKNPKYIAAMKPETKTAWDQAVALYNKWYDQAGKRKPIDKTQEAARTADLTTIGTLLKPLTTAYGKAVGANVGL
jgi:hypothetical protein